MGFLFISQIIDFNDQFILIYRRCHVVLTDHPSVCVALGNPECEMSLFICNYTITFTAAWYYGQFVAQALI